MDKYKIVQCSGHGTGSTLLANIVDVNKISITIPLKNRTSILVDYEPIQLKTFIRHKLVYTDEKDDIKLERGNKIRLNLLLNCLKSLELVKNDNEIFEVILVDFMSDDFDLNKLAGMFPKLEIKIVKVNDYFSRGKGLNVGYRNSSYNTVFFCDADMIFRSRDVFDRAYEILKEGSVFFPICLDLCEPSHQIGYWRTSGYGMSFVTKSDKVDGSWPEYGSLGKEDNDFWDLHEGCRVRERVDGYCHQWHPPTKSFKNKHYKYSDVDKKKVYLEFNSVLSVSHQKSVHKFLEDKGYYVVDKMEMGVHKIVVDVPSDDTVKLFQNYKEKFNKKIEFYALQHNNGIEECKLVNISEL